MLLQLEHYSIEIITPHTGTFDVSSASFGMLRSLCQQAPSRLAFLQIMELLVDAQQKSDPALEPELLPYATGHVSKWPRALCEVGGPFARDMVRQNALAARLVKSLDLSGFDLGEDRVTALLEATNFDGLERLDLSDTKLGLSGISTLCVHPNVHTRQVLAQLEELDLSDNRDLNATCFRLILNAVWMQHVQELWLCRTPLSSGRSYDDPPLFDGIEELPLRRLHLLNAGLSDDHITQLCTADALKHLTHISLSSLGRTEWLSKLGHSSQAADELSSLCLMPCLDAQIAEFSRGALAARLEHLEVKFSDGVSALARASRAQFPSLRALHVHAYEYERDHLTDPEQMGDVLSGLEEIRLNGWRYSGEALDSWLAPGELAPELSVLHVREAPVGDQLAIALALHASEHQVLKELAFHDCQLGKDFALSFAQFTPISSLRRIDLGGNAIGDEALARWLTAHLQEGVRELNLSATELGPKSLDALTNSPALATMRRLDLSYNALPEKELDALLKAPACQGLTHLKLSDSGLDDARIIALNDAACARALRALDLSGNTLSDRGLRSFIRRFEFDALERLELQRNALSARGLTALSRAYKLSRLRTLNVQLGRHAQSAQGAKLSSDDAHMALLTSESLIHLRELDLRTWQRRSLSDTFRRWRSL